MKKNHLFCLFGILFIGVSTFSGISLSETRAAPVNAEVPSVGHLSYSSAGNNASSFYSKSENEPQGISASWSVAYTGTVTYSNSSLVGYTTCQVKYWTTKSFYVEFLGYTAFQVEPQAGDTVLINGVFTSGGDTPQSFSVESTKFTYEYGAWTTVSYTDDELEVYDRVTLRDIGLGESLVLDGTKAYDYEINDISRNYIAYNALNTTGSMALSFDLEFATKPTGRLTFRLRGSQMWTGFQIFIDFDGNFIQIWDAATSSSWAKGNCTLAAGNHSFEYGAIDIKGTNKTWLYAVADNVRVFSVTRDRVAAYNSTRVGLYTPSGLACTLSSTGNRGEFVQKIATAGFTMTNNDIKNSNQNGVYFHMNENDIPFIDGNWGYPCYLLEKDAFSIDGLPASCSKGIIKKTNGQNYYLCLSDNGYTAVEGSLYVLDGFFSMNFNNQKYVFSIENAAIRYLDGQWSVVENPRDMLVEQLNAMVDEDLYDKTNIQTVREIVAAATSGISKAYNYVDANAVYAKAVIEIDKVPVDEEAYKEKLAQYKLAAKAVLLSYASQKQYSQEKQLVVNQIVETANGEIDAAKTKAEVDSAVEKAKGQIDLVQDLYKEIEDAILNQKEGFETYLDQYDVASLNDLNWGDSLKVDEYPNNPTFLDGANSLNNTFVSKTNNGNGNVVFQFDLELSENCKNKYAAVAIIRLRGIQFFSYRFDVGYNGQNENLVDGIRIIRMPNDPEAKQVAFKENVFTEPNKKYTVQVGAIDIQGFDKVWLFAKVDNQIVLNVITDKISFCTNSRVSTSESYTLDGSNSYAMLYNNSTSTTCNANIVTGGYARASQTASSANTVAFDMPQNNISVNTQFAPLSTKTIKFKGNEIADNTSLCLHKYSESTYILDISKLNLEPSEGDILTIDGSFAAFDSDLGKIGLNVTDSSFKFVSGVWQYQMSLNQAKQIGIEEISNYVDLSDYTETNKQTIQNIISNGVTSINNAKTIEEVNDVVTSVKLQIDAVPSILDTYKATKKEELQAYKADCMDLYREAQQQEILAIKNNAYTAINSATNEAAVDVIVLTAKNNINSVKTAEELYAEELATLKEETITEIRRIYNNLDLSKYTEENVMKINNLVSSAQNQVRNASTKEEVNNVLENFKTELNAIPQIQPAKSGCGGSILTTSILISSLSLVGVALLMVKRKKKEIY